MLLTGQVEGREVVVQEQGWGLQGRVPFHALCPLSCECSLQSYGHWLAPGYGEAQILQRGLAFSVSQLLTVDLHRAYPSR